MQEGHDSRRPPAAWWETRRQMVQGRVVGELAHLVRKLRNSLGYGFERHSLICLGYRSRGCRHHSQPIQRALSAVPGLGNRFTEKGQEAEEAGSPGLSDHVVVCGYGRVAQEAVDVLREQGEEVIVIELDPHVVAELRRLDIPHITGDSAIPSVLAHAGVERAKLVLVTVPDTGSAEQVIRAVRTLNSSVRILARTHHPEDLDDLLAAGADEAICPEYQAELEFLRHTMSQLGTSHGEVSEILSRRRDPQLTVPAEG